MNENSEIGLRIKETRTEKKYTQAEAAELSNISRSYYGDIENGRYSASLDTLRSIANALDVSVSYLLTGDIAFEDLSAKDQTRLTLEHLETLRTVNSHELIYIADYLSSINDNKHDKETVELLAKSLHFSFINKLKDENDDPVKLRFLSDIIELINEQLLNDTNDKDILLKNINGKIDYILSF